MSKQPTIKEVLAYGANGLRNGYNYWRHASLRMWVAEIFWLIIVVAMFYYGIQAIMNVYEGSGIDPNSVLGWFISFLPLYFVALLFAAHAMFSTLVKAVFMWLDNRKPK